MALTPKRPACKTKSTDQYEHRGKRRANSLAVRPFVSGPGWDRMLRRNVFLVLLSVSLCGCSLLLGSISYFDPTTYESLTEIKPKVTFLYQTFTEDSIGVAEVRAIRLRLAQMLEYEKGKGPKNHETAQQIRIIRDMFEDDLQHRMKNGKWSTAQRDNQTENISDAFDIAISTERLKNKNE